MQINLLICMLMAGLSGVVPPSSLSKEEKPDQVQTANNSYPLVNIKQYAHKLTENRNLPFDKTWLDYTNLNKYDKVMIDEVIIGNDEENRTKELREPERRKLSERDEQGLKDFAGYIRESFQRAVRNDVNFNLAEQPGPKVLTLKLYLVSLVAAKPLLGAANRLPGAARYGYTAAGKIVPFVAVEAVLSDSVTGKTVFIFADQNSAKAVNPELKDFAAYNALRSIVDVWSALFMKVLNSRQSEEIPKPRTVNIVKL